MKPVEIEHRLTMLEEELKHVKKILYVVFSSSVANIGISYLFA